MLSCVPQKPRIIDIAWKEQVPSGKDVAAATVPVPVAVFSSFCYWKISRKDIWIDRERIWISPTTKRIYGDTMHSTNNYMDAIIGIQ